MNARRTLLRYSQSMTEYQAPWSKSLIVLSVLGGAVCLVASFMLLSKPSSQGFREAQLWVGLAPLVVVGGCALFMVRGYSLTPDSVMVHRLLWSTQVSLAGLESAFLDPRAMRGSIRTFGNGGFFSFCGYFLNRKLGSYRAFVTDPRRAVVLKYSNRRTIVLSPDPPQAFVDMISQLRRGA
ncbi:MAG: PH domain-containing protein [Acidobacteriota bacterium]